MSIKKVNEAQHKKRDIHTVFIFYLSRNNKEVPRKPRINIYDNTSYLYVPTRKKKSVQKSQKQKDVNLVPLKKHTKYLLKE